MSMETTRRIGVALLLTLVMVVAAGAMAPGIAAQTAPAQPPAAQDDFVPIDQLPEDEQLPAAPLVIAAYAVAWIAVFGYLWSIWQRTSRIERELAELARRVSAGGARK